MYEGIEDPLQSRLRETFELNGETRTFANVVRKFRRVSVTSGITCNKRRGTNNTNAHFAQLL